ncbi:MAG: GTP cyclohydrolase FolE2 [Planctomycetota bacterium]
MPTKTIKERFMNPLLSDTTTSHLPDIQSSEDRRRVAINKVGVTDIRHPITLCTSGDGSGNARQHTVANISMFVSLPESEKGTHMSRFMQVLNDCPDDLCSDSLVNLTREIRERLAADNAFIELRFPYFIDKKAPVTGQPGKLDIDVVFEVSAGTVDDLVMTLKVPATSLCPCSKQISEYGAHNQRCEMTVKVRVAAGAQLWIEELFAIVEQCASTQLFSVLKRPDEKWVTEAAYDNPKFVEDIVRDLAVALRDDDRIDWFQCSSENFESIHSHNAFAMVEHDKRTPKE